MPSRRIWLISRLQNVAGQLLGRDLAAEHAAERIGVVEDRAGVAALGRLIGGRQPGRPAGWPPACRTRGDRRQIGFRRSQIDVGHDAFEFADRDEPSRFPRRQTFSQGAGQIRPSAAGRAMSALTVIRPWRSSPAAICEHLRECSSHRAAEQGATQWPRWSLWGRSSVVRRTTCLLRLALDLHALGHRRGTGRHDAAAGQEFCGRPARVDGSPCRE